MSDEDYSDVAEDVASKAGEMIADYTGLGEVPLVGTMIDGAAKAGVAVGNVIRDVFNTDEVISDGLMDLVGDEHSYAAAQAWDDGDYLGVASEMLQGAGETIGNWAGEAYDDAAEWVGGAVDDVGDALGDAADAVGDFFDDIF